MWTVLVLITSLCNILRRVKFTQTDPSMADENLKFSDVRDLRDSMTDYCSVNDEFSSQDPSLLLSGNL